MKIEVTETDINKGDRANGCSCPVALAFLRTFKAHIAAGLLLSFLPDAPAHCIVDHDSIAVKRKDGTLQIVTLPKDVQEFIHQFDGAGNVKPISFELQL